MLVGGSGVSYTLPMFLQTVARVKQGTSNTTRVVFIWVIRDSSKSSNLLDAFNLTSIGHIRWISDALYQALSLAPGGLDIDIRIFITGRSTPDSSTLDDVVQWDTHSIRSESAASDEKEKKVSTTLSPSLLSLPAVTTTFGRPDLSRLLVEEAESMNGGRMSVDGMFLTYSGYSTAHKTYHSVWFHICSTISSISTLF